jgi:hypothetical protein
VTDIDTIIDMGVMSTPALAIDRKTSSSPEEIKTILKKLQ